MAEKFKKVRLFNVSKELKVSSDTIVQHLKEKGHASALEGTGINASIADEEAYLELLEHFDKEKAAAARIRQKRAAREAEEREERLAAGIDEERA